jgi:hypothetical protein
MTDKTLEVLFEGLDVSAEQVEKFQTNLEAVISEKVSAYKSEIDAENEKVIAEQVEEKTNEIADKIDDYLSYVVETWAEENKLAIESGMKLEIMESFIDGMKDLFAEHYVEVPEGKEDMISAAEAKVADLQEDLNTELQKNITMKKELASIKRAVIIKESSNGLTETQKEKFSGLLEDIQFTDVETFEKKVKTIRESFFKAENDDPKAGEKKELKEDKHDPMARYLKVL